MKSISIPSIVLAFLMLAVQALAGPVSHFGALKSCGKNICGEKTGQSTPIFFKGPSLFWSDGAGTPFYNLETVDWFVDNLQIGVIRAAMAIKFYDDGSKPIITAGGVNGYLQNNKAAQKGYIERVVEAAIANDIYVIVDWHSHVAHNETDEAVTFFTEMATKYKDCPNIIWEVYNEPMGASVDQVTNHSDRVIKAIRAAGNNNLAIIGSPSWSTNPSGQASNWGSKDQNVAFVFHFYAGTHGTHTSGQGGGTSATATMNAGKPVFASEWGAVSADGKGSVNTSNSDDWTNWMDQEKISNCMWNASADDQGSSMFKVGTTSSTLSTSNLTASGQYFQTYMNKNKWTAQIPSAHPKGNDVIFDVNDGETATFTATQLGVTGKITEVKSRESFPVEASFTDNSVTYKADGSQKGKVVLIYKVTQNNITIQSKITVNIKNRLPVVPEKNPITVSRKAQTNLSLTNDLQVSDPNGSGVQLMSASVEPTTAGTATVSGSNIVFTPAAGADGTDAKLSYTVKNSLGSRTGIITLQIRNIAPTIRTITTTFAPEVPNTAPVNIGIDRFSGKDADGDDIWFDTVYKDPQYPGDLKKESDGSWVYYPDAGKTGKVYFLAVITDGSLNSPTGRVGISLTGNGTPIGDLPPPTSIPGVIDPEPPEPILTNKYNPAKGMGLSSLGFGKIELYFVNNGFAKLDVYSISGKKMGNLLSGYQNAGSKEVSLKSLNLQKGVYILRLSQGSQVKTLRVVN